MYINYNPNPHAARVGDCVIRAVSKAMGQDWEKTYIDLCVYGLMYGDLPSANAIWGRYLKDNGYKRKIIPDTCPCCYTVEDFEREHTNGTYILALNGHVVAVESGNHFDTWDSGRETPIYYWTKEV